MCWWGGEDEVGSREKGRKKRVLNTPRPKAWRSGPQGEGRKDSGWVRQRESAIPFDGSLPGLLTFTFAAPDTPKPEFCFQVALEKPRCVYGWGGGGARATFLPPATYPIRYGHRIPFRHSRHPDLVNGGKVSMQNESCWVHSRCWLRGSPVGTLGRGCPCSIPLGLPHEVTGAFLQEHGAFT